ncbi:MAG: hypothetical protein M3R35_05255 [Candidatus Eremiobacteraeota bacterium]|nr:hypothetical protein [Candidatus Eremiobacteraeota bacterium]
MTSNCTRALALAGLLALAPAVAGAAVSPRPLPTPRLPNRALHTEFNVEVNKQGQVVLVKSGKSCPDLNFNAKTYGNVLQMWIRRPNGTALVGMYHVTYDYNPKTHGLARHVSLVKSGGNWGNKQGAANNMIDIAKRENAKEAAQAAAARRAHDSAAAKNLPDINSIVRKDVTKKSATPKPHPTTKP